MFYVIFAFKNIMESLRRSSLLRKETYIITKLVFFGILRGSFSGSQPILIGKMLFAHKKFQNRKHLGQKGENFQIFQERDPPG